MQASPGCMLYWWKSDVSRATCSEHPVLSLTDDESRWTAGVGSESEMDMVGNGEEADET